MTEKTKQIRRPRLGPVRAQKLQDACGAIDALEALTHMDEFPQGVADLVTALGPLKLYTDELCEWYATRNENFERWRNKPGKTLMEVFAKHPGLEPLLKWNPEPPATEEG